MNMLLRAGIAASALVVLLATTGCPSDPNTPNTDPTRPTGTLYISGNTQANTYSIDLKTGTTTNMFVGFEPYRTPEGTFIVARYAGLVEVSADGNTSRMIVEANTDFPNNDLYDDAFKNPRLSPNGKYIAYEGQLGGRLDVYVVDRYTGELLLTTDLGFTRPSWTPDNRLVVGGGYNNSGIFITDTDWTTLTRIDGNLTDPEQPIVSPDGKLIALILNKHVYTMNIDGSGLKQITTSSTSESWPTWSPDGKSVAVYGNNSILLLTLTGGGFFDVRTISATMDNFISLTADRRGQFQWK